MKLANIWITGYVGKVKLANYDEQNLTRIVTVTFKFNVVLRN